MESPKQKILKNYILARLGFERGAFLADYIENLTKIVKNYEYLASKKAETIVDIRDEKEVFNDYHEDYREELRINGHDYEVDEHGNVSDADLMDFIRKNHRMSFSRREVVNPDPNKKYIFDGKVFVPESFSLLDYLMLEYKAKKDNTFTKKVNSNSIISATDLANYSYCPVSYSIGKTFETDILKSAAIGSKLHTEKKILNWIAPKKETQNNLDLQKEIEDKYESNRSFFADVRSSKLLYSGHNADNEKKYFINKAGNFVGQPDYIFKNKQNQNFIVEEKFKWGKNGMFGAFYENHKVQLASYIYGLNEFNADYGYLVYWYYDFGNLTGCQVLRISRTNKTRIFLNNSFRELSSFIKDKKQDFKKDKLNPNKCANCVVNRFCGHKTGRFHDIEIPYSDKYLKLVKISYPEELKKKNEDNNTGINEKPKLENLKDILNSIDWDS